RARCARASGGARGWRTRRARRCGPARRRRPGAPRRRAWGGSSAEAVVGAGSSPVEPRRRGYVPLALGLDVDELETPVAGGDDRAVERAWFTAGVLGEGGGMHLEALAPPGGPCPAETHDAMELDGGPRPVEV